MRAILASREPEKFLTLMEFNALLKATNDDRERCILLLLAGAGLRVGEMTQIKAEDIDFSKGYLHVEATNAKFNKPRTVVLLPQVADAITKQINGRSKSWLFPSYREGHISSRQIQNILYKHLMTLAHETKKRKERKQHSA
ncbi:MAG: tyrosine-type recombinase/integrase [Methanotrichaceae archaeon]